jgi:cellulose synthase/poly-beta-1,6-N-acetylglucosamine synthase-like glycosyltransferase
MTEIILGIFIAYYSILLLMIYGNWKDQIIYINKYPKKKQHFSILIPFKNEEKNLEELIDSLNKIKYPQNKFEIIFINDHSIDNGEKIIKKQTIVPYQILKNSSRGLSPKKEALETGINKAQFDYIVTTDADCRVSPYWLEELNAQIQKKHPKMILGPVKYADKKDFLNQFQIFEFISLQAFTSGSQSIGFPFLSNGANLAFDKKSFIEVEGYKGNKHIASGDDIFLLEKFRKRFKKEIVYLKSKNAIVITKPSQTWKKLYQQKIRWASKSKKIKNSFAQVTGASLFLTNLAQIIVYGMLWFNPIFFILILSSKWILEYILIKQANKLLNNKLFIKYFLASLIIYPFYMFYVANGTMQKKYTWKGNKYNT